MKFSPARLVGAHYKTYIDANTGKQRWQDHAWFEGLPLGVLAACWAIGVTLPIGASVGLLTVTGLLSAFLFGVMLQISERAMDWADTKRDGGLRRVPSGEGRWCDHRRPCWPQLS